MSENEVILSDLDTAHAVGLTEKEARKLLMKNQLTTYDVVQEFCISVEHWMTTVKPSTTRMITMLEQIASFMAEFSIRSSVRPPFLRLPIDMAALATNFGGKKAVVSREEAMKKSVESLSLVEGTEELADIPEGSSYFRRQLTVNLSNRI